MIYALFQLFQICWISINHSFKSIKALGEIKLSEKQIKDYLEHLIFWADNTYFLWIKSYFMLIFSWEITEGSKSTLCFEVFTHPPKSLISRIILTFMAPGVYNSLLDMSSTCINIYERIGWFQKLSQFMLLFIIKAPIL